MFLIIVITVSVIVIGYGTYSVIADKKKQAQFEIELCEKGISIGSVKDKLSSGSDNSFIALDDTKEHLIFMMLGSRSELKIIKLRSIHIVQLELDGETVYKRAIGNTLVRAAIGGVVMGGLGAVVGVVTGSTQKIEKLNRATIVTEGESGANCYLHFVDDITPKSLKKERLQLAEKWVRIIEGYI